jgi:hypothetical protein
VRDVLHDWHGALADERDRDRVEVHAVAGDAAGGGGGMTRLICFTSDRRLKSRVDVARISKTRGN